jgi:two-component system sensor histidine kinase and response regulator WspE
MSSDDLSGLSMRELFRMEADGQIQILSTGILALERAPAASDVLEACMRAAHSLKGAARVVDLHAAVTLTHAMEDCFAAAQQGKLALRKPHIDQLLRCVDLLGRIASASEPEQLADSARRMAAELATGPSSVSEELAEPTAELAPDVAGSTAPSDSERYLRVTARNFDQLLGLAGESLVDSRWMQPFSRSLLRIKRAQDDTLRALDALRDTLPPSLFDERVRGALADARGRALTARQDLVERMTELDLYERRASSTSHRLYDEALTCRMRPFSDGLRAFPRMVRDLANGLAKSARLELRGERTQVDRTVLEKLEAPLIHLVRNAIDHGIASPEQRLAEGKAAEGVVRIEARHAGGMLQVSVSDDGQGISCERVRQAIVERRLLPTESAAKLSDSELFEFLFLPGFSLKRSVTEISGRGVGLDAVQEAVKELRGTVRVSSPPGEGATFQLLLPISVSLVRTLLVQIGGEPYAFPLTSIDRALSVPKSELHLLEGRQHLRHQDRQIGLVAAHQLFGAEQTRSEGDSLSIILVSSQDATYGLVVERFLGARELVVQTLDRRLGRIQDVSAGALLEDGSPVLIVDVRDLVLSIGKLTATGDLAHVTYSGRADNARKRKRILVVDDSLTVRELERKLLVTGGYAVEVAVDGLDGWNALRAGEFSLVVTDVDMPRMDGIELVRLIRQDPQLRSLPVMIVSYKDREEDRQRGLEAGADSYLAKSGFHSENLLQAVADLIGEP